ncbi:MAG: hypothetical protein VW945_00005 [Candidatus Poseidoniales archaeon]
MKYCDSTLCSMKQVSARPLRCAVFIACLLTLLAQPFVPAASAGLTKEEGDLFLSCLEDNDCVLSPTPVGEEQISDQTFANIVQPETVVFEFIMSPSQDHIALLPEFLDVLEIDFKHQTESGSLFRPAMDVRLILGENVNQWSFEASTLPEMATSPYLLEDEPLDTSAGRVLWEEASVRLLITVTLDRPGTWSLNMRGASFLQLDVQWSMDAAQVNMDEPSSRTQPVATSFEDVHRGALVGADHDCWAFEIESHEVLRLLVEWEVVPIEIEQPHPIPDLITAAGRLSPTPEVVVDDDGESLRITYRWRALPTGDYTLCMHGSPEKIQPYAWTGVFGYEGTGPTDPTEFTAASYYPQGTGLVGSLDHSVDLDNQGVGLLLVSLLMLGAFTFVAFRPTTAYGVRFGLFVPGVLLLVVGGVLNPAVVMYNQVQHPEEITVDELIDMRLKQLWDVSAEGVPEQTLATHTGATWGMLAGERLQLKLDIDQAVSLDDGRWQLVVPELNSFRLDQAIFGQVAQGQTYTTQEGMLEAQTVRFILLASRSLVLDLMMLEAMLVVDDAPSSSVFHIDAEMVAAPASGSLASPAWATRPSTVDANDWVRLQSALFPERITISLCDCDLDLLDVNFIPSTGFDGRDIPPSWGIQSADGFVPYGGGLMMVGVTLGLLATWVEVQRKSKAEALAREYAPGSDQWA